MVARRAEPVARCDETRCTVLAVNPAEWRHDRGEPGSLLDHRREPVGRHITVGGAHRPPEPNGEPTGCCVHYVLWVWPREAEPATITNVALSGFRLIAAQACERGRNRPPQVLGGARGEGHGKEGAPWARG